MAKRTIRVFKNDRGYWVAKQDDRRAPVFYNTQREAYLAARTIALNQGLTITVYHPTGGIKAVINPKNREEESNCFLTTACVKYFSLRDNCYELQTLRNFRDNYLLKSQEDRNLVNEYYLIAPILVKKLNIDKRRDILFRDVFLKIQSACEAIENGEFEKAKNIYIDAITHLVDYFKTM